MLVKVDNKTDIEYSHNYEHCKLSVSTNFQVAGYNTLENPMFPLFSIEKPKQYFTLLFNWPGSTQGHELYRYLPVRAKNGIALLPCIFLCLVRTIMEIHEI